MSKRTDMMQYTKLRQGHTAELLMAMSKFVHKFGVHETTMLLRELSDFRIATPTSLKNIAVNLVCAELQIKPSDIFGNTNLAGKRVEALRICTFILIKHGRLSQKEVSELLHKDKSAISKYLHDIKNLDSAWRPDRESLETLSRVEKAFKTIIELKNPYGDNEPTSPSTGQTA